MTAALKSVSVFLVIMSLFLLPKASFAQGNEAHIKANTILEHLGDKSLWAKAKGARIMEVHITQFARLPYTHEVWVDFNDPRVMVRVKNQDLRQLRSMMDQKSGWWIQEGTIAPYSEAFQEDEFKRWQGNPYRILHLMAKGDPSLTYQVIDDTTFQVSIDGTPKTQFELGEKGQPIGFRRHNDDFKSLTVMEEFVAYGDVNLWKEVHNPDFSYRSLNLEFELFSKEIPISFEAPKDLHNISR